MPQQNNDTMTNRISTRMVKAFERFDADLEKFFQRTDGDGTLYEDAYTTRNVRNFKLYLNGKLTWTEDGHKEVEQMFDDDEARDYLGFWRANLRRAIRYWSMDAETLDRIQDPENESEESYE